MATIYVCDTYAAACIHLSEQIAQRYGASASIEDFDLKIFDVPHMGSDRRGKALVACPQGEIPNSGNICIAYWGDTPKNSENLS